MADFRFLSEGVQSPLEGLRSGLMNGIRTGLALQQNHRQNQAMQMEQDNINRVLERQQQRTKILSSDLNSEQKVNALVGSGDLEGAQQLSVMQRQAASEERAAELFPLQKERLEQETEAFDTNLNIKQRELDIKEAGQTLQAFDALEKQPVLQARMLDNSPVLQKMMNIDDQYAGGGKAEDLARRQVAATAMQKRLDKQDTAIDKLEIEGPWLPNNPSIFQKIDERH